ncbi:hypothetical protein M422DRAFT_177688 [Sphaerobolus stellatus SS14]|uniref:CxC1-like cysteine cluster associated with KDZ transposases domain-containing protein n=1 Tax=Sphaerobolus stellatus (strain SS14) TaxID=990650 RepID=A0A0C9U3Z7_SPHS4|nr:hypothetical protein M422DRAFT_177688 [Sphaerobolus stellatus SS14]
MTEEFKLVPEDEVTPRRKVPEVEAVNPALRKGVVFALPFGQNFSQPGNLPFKTFTHDPLASSPPTAPPAPSSRDKDDVPHPGSPNAPIIGNANDDWGFEYDDFNITTLEKEILQENRKLKHRHKIRREQQYTRWKQEVIPRLIPLYMDLRFKTQYGKYPMELAPEAEAPCTCGKHPRRIKVTLAYWDRLEQTHIQYCLCKPTSNQLIKRGFFPCAPIQPSLAFDVNLLDLASTNMYYLAPNIAGWALTLEMFWKEKGYVLGQRERLRRRFANAFQWYGVLQDNVKAYVQDKIDSAQPLPRSEISGGYCLVETPSHAAPTPIMTLQPNLQLASPKKPVNACDIIAPTDASLSGDEPRITLGKRVMIEEEVDIEYSNKQPCKPTPKEEEAVTSQPAEDNDTRGDSARKEREALKRPSAYLRRMCPACFATLSSSREGPSGSHVLVCIDANFTQKCLKPKYNDPMLIHPNTHFVPEDDVNHMEFEVEEARGSKRSQGLLRELMQGLLPDSILDDCEESFIAAQEATAKASGKFFIDTGLMALVCRHDRPLWVVNMTTPGEKQFYAFALIKQLFKHLPDHWKIGLLYDIACQLQRSMAKHGILAEYYHRITFAVSVFHAYGHQWACQLLYHPRKRAGFGLTDGEGCKRFWSAIRRLIPSLRISGRYRRRWVLDRQFHFNRRDGLRLLGHWINRKYKACHQRKKKAERTLRKKNVTTEVIHEQWAAQVKAQTAKLQKQSKDAGDREIERIMELRVDRDELQRRIRMLQGERTALNASQVETLAAIAEDIVTAREEMDALTKRLCGAERSLLGQARKKLNDLKGNEFLRLRMNARALKTRIRSKIVGQKFERSRLERVYRHQVTREKDHAPTKKLLKRGHHAVTALVNKFNNLVKQMKRVVKKGDAPRGARVPKPLKAKQLFCLDVDDEIWNEDGLLADNQDTPPWLGDQDVRDAISAQLELDRVKEEQERLAWEEEAMMVWIEEEKRAMQIARIHAESKLLN